MSNNWSNDQYRAHQLKMGIHSDAVSGNPGDEVEREIPLHNRIMIWCNSRFPQVPYIHARTDKGSTVAKGCHDFTIFYKGKTFCIECKSKAGKLSADQTIWAALMSSQQFEVHIVRSFDEFLALVMEAKPERRLL